MGQKQLNTIGGYLKIHWHCLVLFANWSNASDYLEKKKRKANYTTYIIDYFYGISFVWFENP